MYYCPKLGGPKLYPILFIRQIEASKSEAEVSEVLDRLDEAHKSNKLTMDSEDWVNVSLAVPSFKTQH